MKSGTASLHPNMESKKSRDGFESNSDAQSEPIGRRRRGRKINSTDVTNNMKKNVSDSGTQGVLDDFLNAQGPSSLIVETVVPSPDKTTSELVSLQVRRFSQVDF